MWPTYMSSMATAMNLVRVGSTVDVEVHHTSEIPDEKVNQRGKRQAKIPLEHWKKLVALQDNPTLQEKLQLMSKILLGRPSKAGSTW